MAIVNGQWNNELRFHSSPETPPPPPPPRGKNRRFFEKSKNHPPNTGWKLVVGGGRDWVGSELVSAKGQKLRVIMKPINGCCQSARYAQSPPRYASSLPACLLLMTCTAQEAKYLHICRSSIWSKWAAPLTHPFQSRSSFPLVLGLLLLLLLSDWLITYCFVARVLHHSQGDFSLLLSSAKLPTGFGPEIFFLKFFFPFFLSSSSFSCTLAMSVSFFKM